MNQCPAYPSTESMAPYLISHFVESRPHSGTHEYFGQTLQALMPNALERTVGKIRQ